MLNLNLPPLGSQSIHTQLITATPLRLYIDGSCNPNPGPMKVGLVLYKDNEIIWKNTADAGMGTNSEAEYMALLQGVRALEVLYKQHPEYQLPCSILSDSKTMVTVFQRKQPPKKPSLQVIYEQISIFLQNNAQQCFLHWIPRSSNVGADELSKVVAVHNPQLS